MYELFRNAEVGIRANLTKDGPAIVATIAGLHEHEFSAKSNVSKAMMHTALPDIQQRLNGGHYFFIDGNLIDFRDGPYVNGNGFTHTDDSIASLWNTIGCTKASVKTPRQMLTRAALGSRMTIQSKTTGLFKVWSENEINVPMYNEGGKFNNRLCYAWSPFNQDVRSFFELVRLICVNGMVGLTSFLNSKIPLVNRWHEHLDIAALQIQRKVEDKVGARLIDMGGERSSLADLLLLNRHVMERLDSGVDRSDVEVERLRTLSRVVNPVLHLSTHYRPAAFADSRVAAQLPGHLTAFDVWNVATELSSHTSGGGESTDNGLQRMANRLVFDPANMNFKAARYNAPPKAMFSNPERAFFSDLDMSVVN